MKTLENYFIFVFYTATEGNSEGNHDEKSVQWRCKFELEQNLIGKFEIEKLKMEFYREFSILSPIQKVQLTVSVAPPPFSPPLPLHP